MQGSTFVKLQNLSYHYHFVGYIWREQDKMECLKIHFVFENITQKL